MKWKLNPALGENGYVTFTVEGNPAPEVQFYKGFKDLSVEPRYKIWTDGSGENNLAILGINACRQEEEGSYKCIIKNSHGEAEFEFKYFVTVEGGMDFRFDKQ